jgi:Ni/Co efflux regulator RcnB
MKSVRIIKLVITALLIQVAFTCVAQPKTDAQKVTPQTARKKEAESLEKKQNEYQSRKDHHLESQDKATRKRMKKNLRKARRQSWGKNVPWYKRWFRRQ